MPPSKKSKTLSKFWTKERLHYLFFGLLAFSCGLYCFFLFPSLNFIVALFSSLLFLLLALKKSKRTFLVALIALSSGIGVASIRLPEQNPYGTYVGVVYERKENYFLYLSEGKRYYVYEKDESHEVGDILAIEGHIKPYEATVYESKFDFGNYLKSRGVYATITSYKEKKEIVRMPLRLREKEQRFLAHFSSNSRALINSFLFDEKDYSSEILAQASSLNALYFLSSSGFLLSLFCRLLEKFLSLGLSDKKSHLITFIVSLLFFPFHLGKIGFWRVIIARGLGCLYEGLNWERPSNLLFPSLSALTLVVIDPLAPLRSGFLLGYGLSFYMNFERNSLSKFTGVKNKIWTRVSLLLFLLPLYISNDVFHLLSPLYSLLLLPFFLPYVSIALISFCSLPFVNVLNGYSQGASSFLNFLSLIDLRIPILKNTSYFGIFIYYLALLGFSYFGEIGWKSYQKKISLALAIVYALNAMPFGEGISGQVSFINVGQGDGIFIRDGYQAVMIDTGGNLTFDLASEVDIPFLYKQGILHLDAIIESHSDFDHVGAEKSLYEHFNVKRVIRNASSFPLTIGRMSFTNYNVYGGSESNEKSLVVSLTLAGQRFLFTGDAPISLEKKIIKDHPELRCDILKVGHHGSATSSCRQFLETITPKVGIISVAKVNHYGHPAPEVIALYEELKIPLRLTSKEGTITYSYFGKKEISLS